MKAFDLGIAKLSQTEGVDEFNNLVERRFDDRLARPRRDKAQHRALPQLLIATFRHRDVKLIADPRLNTFQNSTFALERMVFGNQQLEFENSHDHRNRRSRKPPAV